jgi:hypothetical protein
VPREIAETKKIRRVCEDVRKRLTKDQIYIAVRYAGSEKFFVTDDNGNPMQPSFNNRRYWEIIEEDKMDKPKKNPTPATELPVEDVTLIYGERAQFMSDDALLNTLTDLRAKRDSIKQTVGNESLYGITLTRKYDGYINRIIKLLDDRVRDGD